TARLTQIQGTSGSGIVKDKLAEMIHLVESTYASAIGASAAGKPLACGSCMVDPLMANATKLNITRNVYEIARLSHDLAGGFIATLPEASSLDAPEIGDHIRKYLTITPGDDVMERVRMGRYVENATSVTTVVEAMHGAGSPQAQRISMLRLADLETKVELAQSVIGWTSEEEAQDDSG
ncbi:MAG: 4-hydroxyphenylacetate 3-hydroxylase C-terminal domain-containing protein, partial [Phycisphaerales bacterium]